MSIFDKVKEFSFDKNESHMFGIKSAIIWGESIDTNSQFPILYLTKPKYISDEEYKEILDKILIYIKTPIK